MLLLLTTDGSELSEDDRRALVDRLTAEQRDGAYGEVTTEAVARFQREHWTAFDLPFDTGEQVDDATAAAMNRMLQELGVFERAPLNDFLVTGQVEFEDGTPGAGMRVSAFDRDLGSHRVLLGDPEHPVVTAENGVFPAIRYHAREAAEGEGRMGPNANLVFEVSALDDQGPRAITSLYRRLDMGSERTESLVPDLVLGFEAGHVEDVRIVLTERPGQRGLFESSCSSATPSSRSTRPRSSTFWRPTCSGPGRSARLRRASWRRRRIRSCAGGWMSCRMSRSISKRGCRSSSSSVRAQERRAH